MLRQQFVKYVFVVLALALWAGTAQGTITASGGPLGLTYVVGGGTSGQGSDTDTATLIVTSSVATTGEALTALTFTGTTCTSIFNSTTVTAGGNALPGGSPLTVSVNESSTKLTALATATDFSCTLTVTSANNSVTFSVVLHAVMQPLLVVPSVANTTLGSSVVRSNPVAGAAVNAKVKVVAATYSPVTTFIVDPSTVPQWLTVSPTLVSQVATASAGGNTVAFQVVVGPALSALPIGNTTITVSFIAVGFSYEVGIPFTMTVLDDPGTLSLLEGPTATINRSWTKGTPIPIPSVTPVASNGAVAYAIGCVVSAPNAPSTTSKVCKFGSGTNTVQGVALPVGSPVTMTFSDPKLFNTSLYGVTVDVTLTVNTVPAGTPIVIDYVYTVQPADPTLVSLSPTAINQGLASGSAAAVTLTGTGFVGPKDCVSGVNPPVTHVFVGGTDRTNRAVVLSSTLIVLNIVADDSDIPALGGATSATLPLGVANVGLTVLTAPVRDGQPYGNYRTRGLQHHQHGKLFSICSGSAPNVAPYEMVSIFGDNFAMVGNTLGALDAFYKYGTALSLDGPEHGAGLIGELTSTAKGSTAIAAPILFANATQINVLVPSALVPSATVPVNVVVTSGTATSATFPVNIIAADPGIFTMSASGIGQGAILNAATYVLNGSGAAAADHTADTIAIFLAGMGTPNSMADDATTTKGGRIRLDALRLATPRLVTQATFRWPTNPTPPPIRHGWHPPPLGRTSMVPCSRRICCSAARLSRVLRLPTRPSKSL